MEPDPVTRPAMNDICVLCQGPTDPEWYCSEGYCPECCIANDTEMMTDNEV
jgi:hypothetical protein